MQIQAQTPAESGQASPLLMPDIAKPGPSGEKYWPILY
jgi:hypothetical protein